MKTLTTEIAIAAPPSVVWEILTDLAGYAAWNPFVIEAEGAMTVGSRLRVRLQPPGGRATTFRPTVTVVDPKKKFEWLGHLGPRGIFDGRHQFELEASSEGTRFIQSEEFGGILVPLFARSLDKSTKEGFKAMNLAIKERAEMAVRRQA